MNPCIALEVLQHCVLLQEICPQNNTTTRSTALKKELQAERMLTSPVVGSLRNKTENFFGGLVQHAAGVEVH